MERVIAALAKTVQTSKAHARNQKENVRFERAIFTSAIARSGSAAANRRNLLRMAASGKTPPMATPRTMSITLQPIFLGRESGDSKKRRRPLIQRSGPKPKKITQAKVLSSLTAMTSKGGL